MFGVTGLPLTSVGVCLCLLTLTSVIETGEAITTREDCGRSSFPLTSNSLQPVHDAVPGQWPWQVYLKRNGKFNCGGILLNDRWVATATQCVGYSPASDFRVVLESYWSNVVEFHEHEKRVAHIVRYPDYGVYNNTFNNDLSLLLLCEEVWFTKYIKPVCLPERPLNIGDVCYISGWRAAVTVKKAYIDPNTVLTIHFKHAIDAYLT